MDLFCKLKTDLLLDGYAARLINMLLGIKSLYYIHPFGIGMLSQSIS